MLISLLEVLIHLNTTVITTHWGLILFVLLLHWFHLFYWRILTRTLIFIFNFGTLRKGEFNYNRRIQIFLWLYILTCIRIIRVMALLARDLAWNVINWTLLYSDTILKARCAFHWITIDGIITLKVHILIW